MKNKNLPAGRPGDRLDFLSKCSFCNGDFALDSVILLEEKEQKTTVHVTCMRCKTSAIFLVSNNQGGVISLGVVTDLDQAEVKKKFYQGVVSADEVIDAHQLVSSNLLELVKNKEN